MIRKAKTIYICDRCGAEQEEQLSGTPRHWAEITHMDEHGNVRVTPYTICPPCNASVEQFIKTK